jgi:hypothetical protein
METTTNPEELIKDNFINDWYMVMQDVIEAIQSNKQVASYFLARKRIKVLEDKYAKKIAKLFWEKGMSTRKIAAKQGFDSNVPIVRLLMRYDLSKQQIKKEVENLSVEACINLLKNA